MKVPESQALALLQFAKTLVRYARPLVLGYGILLIAQAFLRGIGILMLLPMLAFLGLTEGVATGPVAQLLTLFFETLGLPRHLALVLLLYVVLVSLQAVLARWQHMLGIRLQLRLTAVLRRRFYEALAYARWHFFAQRRPSDFTQILTEEVKQVGGVVVRLQGLGVKVTTAVIYLGLSFYLSWPLTLLTCACAGGLALLTRPTARTARDTGHHAFRYRRALFAAISAHLQGMKVVKSYGAEPAHIAHFSDVTNDLDDQRLRYQRSQSGLKMWASIGAVVLLSGLLFVAVEMLAVPTAALLLLVLLFARLLPMFTTLQQDVHDLLHQLPAFEAFLQVQAAAEAAQEPSHTMAVQRPSFADKIRLEGVSFRYTPPPAPLTLSDLTCVLPVGQVVGLVGPSGAGKSTVADLLMGLLEPTQGTIYLDDQPLEPVMHAAWRAQIGYVPQETFLFHDTIRANLRWACPEATEAAMRAALDQAAAGFVWDLPQGLDTVVGERGVRLSGGERQRLALARALLRQPRLLILDEATSALDAEHEARILQALYRLQGRLTMLVITHRLSTVRHADHILVLEQGRIVEAGTWAALVDQADSRFRAMTSAFNLDAS